MESVVRGLFPQLFRFEPVSGCQYLADHFVSFRPVPLHLAMASVEAEQQVTYRCSLCNLTYAVEAGRRHGQKFQCTPCASADRLLRRGLGSKEELQCLSSQEQEQFFQKLHKEKEDMKESRIQWRTVRATLLTSLCTRQMTENSATVDAKFLPLAV